MGIQLSSLCFYIRTLLQQISAIESWSTIHPQPQMKIHSQMMTHVQGMIRFLLYDQDPAVSNVFLRVNLLSSAKLR